MGNVFSFKRAKHQRYLEDLLKEEQKNNSRYLNMLTLVKEAIAATGVRNSILEAIERVREDEEKYDYPACPKEVYDEVEKDIIIYCKVYKDMLERENNRNRVAIKSKKKIAKLKVCVNNMVDY